MIWLLGLVVALVLFFGPSWIAAPLAWMLCGYLVTRAWPGVRRDLSALRGRGLPRPVRRRARGAHL